jgi:ABC-2 type transport system permease protein
MSMPHPGSRAEIPEPRFGFWRRSYAMVVKEFIQLRRDRVSFGMIVMIPVMQLLLFGYAINTTPRNLPTAVLMQEDSDLARSILKALENTSYFHFTQQVHDVAEFDRLLTSGKVLFGVEIPRGFERGTARRLSCAAGRSGRDRSRGGKLGVVGTRRDRSDRVVA